VVVITVAVTGGIGSGKSTVSGALGDHGAVVVDSDQLARQVVAPGTSGLAAVADAFGTAMIGPDGALDRAALASVVFADPAARKTLEGITHPLVRARFAEIQRAAAPDAVVVNDIPLLTTLAAAATFHLVVGVQANPELRVQRLIGRGLTESDARARMAAQLTDEQRAPLCDVVLINHGDRDELRAAVADLWRDRLLPFAENTRTGRRADGPTLRLVDPQPQWVVAARRLAARVSRAAGGARVDHIGSTAIPGMPAKDVIDLQLTVASLAEADELAPALAAAGFPRADGLEEDNPHPPADDRARWVKRLHTNADPGQSVNLHVRVRDWPNWRWALLFRDWLTADPVIAGEYLTVKRSAVERAGGSRDSYALLKEPWIEKVYQRGMDWAASTEWTPGESS
jgi:dephospho-CoA kinase